MARAKDLSAVGGQKIALSAEGLFGEFEAWDFGWVSPERRTVAQQSAADTIQAQVDPLRIVGQSPTWSPHAGPSMDKAGLWTLAKQVNNGQHLPNIRQYSGCCVGAGGGTALFYTQASKIQRTGQGRLIQPFWLLPYGRSRYYLGTRGQGEGSSGTTFAKAATTDGYLAADQNGLPQYNDNDGQGYDKQTELQWSDGARIPDAWLTMSRQTLARAVAKCNSRADVRDAICNGYACTTASTWGGNNTGTIAGNPAVLLNWHATTWNHQQSIIGWWMHPTLGELFFVMNQWGPGFFLPDGYKANPDDSPPGGYWVRSADMDFMVSAGETYAFSDEDLFPARDISWYV